LKRASKEQPEVEEDWFYLTPTFADEEDAVRYGTMWEDDPQPLMLVKLVYIELQVGPGNVLRYLVAPMPIYRFRYCKSYLKDISRTSLQNHEFQGEGKGVLSTVAGADSDGVDEQAREEVNKKHGPFEYYGEQTRMNTDGWSRWPPEWGSSSGDSSEPTVAGNISEPAGADGIKPTIADGGDVMSSSDELGDLIESPTGVGAEEHIKKRARRNAEEDRFYVFQGKPVRRSRNRHPGFLD
jgi:hypothetical protein